MPTVPARPDAIEKDPPVHNGRDAVEAAADADPDKLHPVTAQNATDWFFSEEQQEAESTAKAIVPVNVAPAGKPKKVQDFTLQVLGRDQIREIREGCMKTLPDGSREVDDVEANLRMVATAMLVPDLKAAIAAGQKVRGQLYLDPADMLTARFAHKPGVIDLLAGKLTEISGYNSADVMEVRAAGN